MEEKNVLKGNFETKKKVILEENPQDNLTNSQQIAKDLKETVLQALGGSMVYVERTNLSWDGNSDKKGE
ncbi:MAG: hypothetical protein H0W64_10510 [Gammaproteobacteria bacterium]|nr:hypothetical protein [Gammaproteobacteria bacterium]